MKPKVPGALVLTALAVTVTLVLVLGRGAGVEAVYPAERAKQQFARRVWTRIRGAMRGAAASAENARLRREIGALTLLQADYEKLLAENERLRKALDYTAGRRGEWLAAAVLSTGGGAAGTRRTIRVDRGSLAGVEKGAAVLVPEGLVGRVRSVTPHTAEILLVTDPAFRFSCEAELPGAVRPCGILCGGDNALLAFTHIRPESAEIPPRTRIVTSGFAGVFPRGLEVGTYVGNGAVEPSVDYSALEDVFIRRVK